MRSIAILGASADRGSMSNKAVRAYLAAGYQVFPITSEVEAIEGLETYESVLDVIPHIDRAGFYLTGKEARQALEDCAQKGVVHVFLDPDSDNEDLVAVSEALNLEPVRQCCIRALGVDPETV